MTVAFVTFGCRLNRAENLDLAARCRAAGHTVADLPPGKDMPPPEVIVVRGCSVTARAQRDCEKAIARLRTRYPASRIRITGCLPGAERLEADGIDSFALGDWQVPLQTSRGYLKVQDGCSGKCAFCIVPSFRGPPTSVPFDTVLARARAFLRAGFRELVVTGCNLALYRSQGKGLADLLAALAQTTVVPDAPPVHRVRLGSLEPGIADAALLDAFERHPNLCRFLHLSLQSGSDKILAAMRRPYGIGTVADFCREAVRRLGSGLALGADLIAGFPGETESDHAATRDFLASLGPASPFVNLHVFPYSERPGTPAAAFAGTVPRAVRLRRAAELTEIGKRNRAAFAARFAGRTVEVCVERDGNGWTGEYLRCELPPGLPRRALVRVGVTRVAGDRLVARIGESTQV